MSKKDDELFQDLFQSEFQANLGKNDVYKNFKEARERREQLSLIQNMNNPDYGYSLQNPIMTSSVRSSYQYLSRLRTADGLKLSWNRIGSICLESLYGVESVMVDKYQLLLDNENYRTIYICPYGHDGDYAPRGMYLAQEGDDQDNNESVKNENGGYATPIMETVPAKVSLEKKVTMIRKTLGHQMVKKYHLSTIKYKKDKLLDSKKKMSISL